MQLTLPQVTVIIASRNRRETCANAVASALQQRDCDAEIIVVDDGSRDETAEYIAERFPTVIVEKLRPGIGTSAARNVAARRARAPILAWIDDDAVFAEPHTLRDVTQAFTHPRVGAMTVPYVNHANGVDERTVVPLSPDDTNIWLTSAFVGVACAMRRDVYNGLGGCEPRLIHWIEEAEFCVRLHGAGYVVRIGPKGLIRHFIVRGKYNAASQRRLSRNTIFAIWLNVPLSFAPGVMLGQLIRGLQPAFRRPSHATAVISGLCWGLFSSLKAWPTRKPISRRGYKAYLIIRSRKPVRLEEIEPILPPRVDFAANTSDA